MARHKLLFLSTALFTSLFLALAGGAGASSLITQTAVPGDCIPQFATPLPIFGPGYNAALPRVDSEQHPALTVTLKETSRAVLPAAGYPATYTDPWTGTTQSCPAVTVQNTRVWAYETTDTVTGALLGPAYWPAVTVEAKRYSPNVMTYVNNLPSFNVGNPTGPGMVQGLVTVDKTIDWADPLGEAAANNCGMWPPAVPLAAACTAPYAGSAAPAPAAVHLHGGEVPGGFDGGPLQWFTPDGRYGKEATTLYNAGPGNIAYLYNNEQEPGTLWFHDHVMGLTRTNVYSGMAAFYFLRDPLKEPQNLPSGAYEIEMAFQDRQFDTNSQLFWPDGSPSGAVACGSLLPGDPCMNGAPTNPAIHPFWSPEFLGDVAIVNGSPWPYMNAEPRRYRLRLLGGSNARMWRLNFGSVPVYVIGSDDNYLDAPVSASVSAVAGSVPAANNTVFIAPGERVDVIVDFTNFAGQTITVTNNAPAPFPVGLVPGVNQPGMANVMQFNVNLPLIGSDTSCNPAVAGQCARPQPMVRLANGSGQKATGVKIDKKRQLILKEISSPTGPVMVTVNNTLYFGKMSPGVNALGYIDDITETPQVGAVEEWEIINMTMDAHPMHTHLVQFQILNRESFQTGMPGELKNYTADWAAAFPAYPAWIFPAGFSWQNPAPAPNDLVTGCTGGVFCPGYGPPLAYNVPNADGAVGGNPAVGPYLKGDVTAPDPWESGWKDTAKALPGQVVRLLVRWAPTDTPVTPFSSLAGFNAYSFDPTEGPGYVWHCHIIDHEDNDMMRPYKVSGPFKGYDLSTEALQFNSTLNVQSAAQKVTITNTGTLPLTFSNITIWGANQMQFSQTNNCGSALAAGLSCDVNVKFKPTWVNPAGMSATLNVNTSSPYVSKAVALSGRVDVSSYTVTPGMLEFSSAMNVQTAVQTITVSNTGTLPMAISSISVGGTNALQFAQNNNCGSSLAVGASCVVNVTFRPTWLNPAPMRAALNIVLAAPAASSSVALVGKIAAYTLAPASLDFSSSLFVRSPEEDIIITNTGTAPLTINSIAIGGTNALQFAQNNNCGSSLAVGANCVVGVTFRPTWSNSPMRATLNVNVAAPGISRSAALTGTIP